MTVATASPTHAELNAVLDQARRPSPHPAPIAAAQLLGLQHRWTTALSARLDAALEFAHPGEQAHAVATAWRELARDLDTLRRILDTHEASSPALVNALRAEHRMLAITAGLATLDAPIPESIHAGRAFRELIRSGPTEPTPALARAS